MPASELRVHKYKSPSLRKKEYRPGVGVHLWVSCARGETWDSKLSTHIAKGSERQIGRHCWPLSTQFHLLGRSAISGLVVDYQEKR